MATGIASAPRKKTATPSKDKKHPPPATKPSKTPNRKGNYSFEGADQTAYSATPHIITVKMIVKGIPRPLYRNNPRINSNPKPGSKKLQFYNPCQDDLDTFVSAIEAAKKVILARHKIQHLFSQGTHHPLSIKVRYLMPRPKTHYEKVANGVLKLSANAPILYTQVPDIDNCNKLVYDCCTKALWKDDCAIADAHATQLWWSPSSQGNYIQNQESFGYTTISIRQIQWNSKAPKDCRCAECENRKPLNRDTHNRQQD